jgi:hypothetical protein
MVMQMMQRQLPGARRAVATVLATAALLLVACATSTIPTGTDPFQEPPTTSETPPPPVPGSAGSCNPGSPRVVRDNGIEVQGVSESGRDVYALFATDAIQPITTTIVWWRVSGDGAFRLTLVGPDGRIVKLANLHPGQLPGWDRPGEPWVGSINFPSAGCWRVYFLRGRVGGDLWVEVG